MASAIGWVQQKIGEAADKVKNSRWLSGAEAKLGQAGEAASELGSKAAGGIRNAATAVASDPLVQAGKNYAGAQVSNVADTVAKAKAGSTDALNRAAANLRGEPALPDAFAEKRASAALRAQAELANPNLASDIEQRKAFVGESPKPAAQPRIERPFDPGAGRTGAPTRIPGEFSANAAAQETAAKPTLRAAPAKTSTFGRLAKGAGVVGLGLAGADAFMKADAGVTPEQQNNMAGPVLGGAIEAFDNMTFGQGRKFVHGVKGAMDAAGNNPKGLRDIVSGFGSGWDKGAALNNPTPAAAPTPQQPGEVQSGTIPGWKPEPQAAAVDPNNGPDGTGVPPEGTGSFRRTTPGNPGQVVQVGSPQPAEQPGAPAPAPDPGAGLRDQTAALLGSKEAVKRNFGGGVFGDMAAGVAAGRLQQSANLAENTLRGNAKLETDRRETMAKAGVAQTANELARAKLGLESEKEQEARHSTTVADHVRAKLPSPEASLMKDGATRAAYEGDVKQKTASVMGDVRYSLNNHGKKVGAASQAEVQQLLLADQVRDRVSKSRDDSTLQWVKDFTGNKRFDSKDLYSYLPARDKAGNVKPATRKLGGWYVTMGNGNEIRLPDAVGGGWNPLSPNDPVNNDMDELMRPAVEAAQKAGK